METFAQLWDSYWWLIFPLGAGVVAIVGKISQSAERAAKRRHQRRLEMIKAKAEIKTAQIAARSGRLPTQSHPLAQQVEGAVAAGLGRPASTGGETNAAQLARLFATHDAVTARWLDYELDVAKLIAFPAMSDGRQPLTAAFLRAQRIADGLRPASPKARVTPQQLTEYRNAVADYEVAFEVAERDARRIKDSSFTEIERKRLDKAKQLLTIATDQAATPAERQVAYKRVREELDGLIALSDDAIVVLEEQVALEITAGTDAEPDAAPEPQPDLQPEPLKVPRTGQWPVPSRAPRAQDEPPTS